VVSGIKSYLQYPRWLHFYLLHKKTTSNKQQFSNRQWCFCKTLQNALMEYFTASIWVDLEHLKIFLCLGVI